MKITSLNLTNQHKRTTQPKLTNYIHPHLDSGFTPSNSTHYNDLTNTSSPSTMSSSHLHTFNTLPLSLSILSTSNQHALESPQTHQIIPSFHLESPDITSDFSINSKSQSSQDYPNPYDNDSPPRRTRSLSDIYKELDQFEAHFVDLDMDALIIEEEPDTTNELIITVREALSGTDGPKWRAAMEEEMTALLKNKTWSLVDPPPDRQIVSCKWVLRKKTDATGNIIRFKARLVARGFSQIPGIDFKDTFSPTLRSITFRIFVSLAVELDLELHHLDVQTAFLHGELEEEIYMQQPPHFEDSTRPNVVCRLHRSLYGLRQSPRVWYHRLHNFLTNNGYKRLKNEPNVYIKRAKNNFIIIGVYVDDLPLLANSLAYLQLAKKELQQAFPITDLGPMKYFLGMNLQRDRAKGTISLSQTQYIESVLKRFDMLHCKPISTPMSTPCKLSIEDAPRTIKERDEMLNVPYKQILGCIRYLVSCTRPDLCFTAGILSRFMQDPGPKHWQALKRLLRYLKRTKDMVLTYSRSQSESINMNLEGWTNPSQLSGWTDSDWGGDVDGRKSTSGFVYCLAGAAIAWRSKKQTTVALSSTEAEYVAAALAAKEGIWIHSILEELNLFKTSKLILHCDNQSCIKLACNPKMSDNIRHVSFKHHFLRDLIEEKKLDLKYASTTLMWADFLTKPVPQTKHIACCRKIGLTMPNYSSNDNTFE